MQPTGPYLLGDACAGGVIAFEAMARHLLAQGETLAGPVLLFDAFLSNNPYVEGEDLAALRAARLYPEPRAARGGAPARRPSASRWGPSRRDPRLPWRVPLRRASASPGRSAVGSPAPAREVAFPGGGPASSESSPDALRVREMAESVNVAVRLSNGYHPQRLPVRLVCFEAPQPDRPSCRGVVSRPCGSWCTLPSVTTSTWWSTPR